MDALTEIEGRRNEESRSNEATWTQIRGSSLLLSGNVLSLAIGFIPHLLLVRYLSLRDYGIWAYSLSVVSICQALALSLNEAMMRFVPKYHLQHEYNKLFGTIILAYGVTLAISAAVVAGFYAAPEWIAGHISKNQEPSGLLLIMIFLVPIEAFDMLQMNLFACFARPLTIFSRSLLDPCVRSIVVLLLILRASDIRFLAIGYLSASAAAMLVYGWLMVREMRRLGLFQNLIWREIAFPAREMITFSVPQVAASVVGMFQNSMTVLLLGYFHGMTSVAYYRVVLPAAALNNTVFTAFTPLYTPSASRLAAKHDYKGINHLYWKTALWMGVLTFPIFAVTFGFARTFTVFLYGERYEQSALALACLAFGYYFNVALGFNGLTVKILGRIRYMVIVNVISAVISIVLSLALIPRYGALGAALGMMGTMIAQNILKQLGLRTARGISFFDREYLSFYLIVIGCALALFFLQFLIPLHGIVLALTIATVISCFVLLSTKDKLNTLEIFPATRKLPLLARLLG